MDTRIQALLNQLTLEEKVMLTVGQDHWHTQAIERLGIPAIALNDGPSGIRKPYKNDVPSSASMPATCFPAASALASSWDVGLVEKIGQALGEECQAMDVQVLLGPGINTKRTPLCGRNFEYYSEDPVLSGEMGSAFVLGVQSKGVGTSLKHFACNNQEVERMTISAEVDPRTLREIYLAAFERVVKKAQPWTVMAAYNKVNGTFASEHRELLHTILKTEWGYTGVVVSDWGAVNEKPQALAASLDLEMPGRTENRTATVVQQVNNGSLSVEVIDEAVARILQMVLRAEEKRQHGVTFDQDAHHALARQAASEAMVLLKNDDHLLPLQPEAIGSLALIGRFSKNPRYQGTGSARVAPTRLDNAYDELQQTLGSHVHLTYTDGYTEDNEIDQALLQEAVDLARTSDVTIILAGLTDKDEAEGSDRNHIDLSEAQNQLIQAVCQIQPYTIVVLYSGSAVTMPWINNTKAVLAAGLGGQASGGALVDVLLGRVNPSGKLAETFPVRLEDTPAYLNYPGEAGRVYYGEGLFVGYRYYDRKKLKPLFPFGYGLSYTTFKYVRLNVSQQVITDQDNLDIIVTICNTGSRAGKEVVQVYVRDIEARVARPEKELKAFAKIALEPGEEKDVLLSLEPRDFAFYDSEQENWCIETGEFEILLGGSSEHTALRTRITLNARPTEPHFHKWQPLKQFFLHPIASQILIGALAQLPMPAEEDAGPTNLDMITSLPLIKLPAFGVLTEERIDQLVEQINQAIRAAHEYDC